MDDYSRWLTIYTIKHKYEAVESLKDFISRSERKLNRKVINIRSDNGLEFVNKELNAYFSKLGINHERTNVASPEMNGVAEKINGDSMSIVRTLLIASKLKSGFWGEALMYYAHVRNRMPHSTDKKKTPFEKWFGWKPNISYFRTFGSLCFFM